MSCCLRGFSDPVAITSLFICLHTERCFYTYLVRSDATCPCSSHFRKVCALRRVLQRDHLPFLLWRPNSLLFLFISQDLINISPQFGPLGLLGDRFLKKENYALLSLVTITRWFGVKCSMFEIWRLLIFGHGDKYSKWSWNKCREKLSTRDKQQG